MSVRRVRVEVNGRHHELELEADRILIDVLRDDLTLTGTKEGCGVGVCGLCAVLVDGELMTACLLPAVRVDGASVVTIEGLRAPDGGLTPLQEAFIHHGGFQCGICTSGQIVSATALLAERPRPTPEEIREWMMGSLCRCTGYEGILRAITSASGGHPK